MPLGLAGHQTFGEDRQDMRLDQVEHALGRGNLTVDALLVLMRNNDLQDLGWLAVLIEQGHLALGIGLELGQLTGVTKLGQTMQDVVAVLESRRHKLRRLVGRIAEHDALIARALILGRRRINALSNMR